MGESVQTPSKSQTSAIATAQLGRVPFSPRGLISEFEEQSVCLLLQYLLQSRICGGQNGVVEDQTQY
jgi:hypothetical protein